MTLTTWVISNVNKYDCKTNQTNSLLLLASIIGPIATAKRCVLPVAPREHSTGSHAWEFRVLLFGSCGYMGVNPKIWVPQNGW